jgi:hypothetical protein
MLHVLQGEYHGRASPLDAELYYGAFQIAITHGDQARASVVAGRGYDARFICLGEDSPDTAQMKAFKANPSMHRNFWASNKMRTAKTAVPKGLDDGDFEKWLWRSTGK